MSKKVHEVTLPSGTEVKIRRLEPEDETTARVEVWQDDGPHYEVTVTRRGEAEIAKVYREDDGEVEWLDEVGMQVQRAA